MNLEKERVLLAIPGMCVDQIITLYHSHLFAGHQGIVKMYLTMADKFFIPDLMHYLHSYIRGCHICELSYKKEISEEIGNASIDNVISKYGIPEYMIMDKDSTFMSTIMSYLFKRLNIKIKTVAPFNHQSLQAEHGIKSLSSILTKHLTEQGQMWPKYLPLATLAYNTFNSPKLANYSPYLLVFGRKPKILLDFETDPDIKILGTFTNYYQLLEKRLKYLQHLLQQFKSCHLAVINKNC